MRDQKKKAKFPLVKFQLEYILFTLAIAELCKYLWTLQTSPLFSAFKITVLCILSMVWYNVSYVVLYTDDKNEKLWKQLTGE